MKFYLKFLDFKIDDVITNQLENQDRTWDQTNILKLIPTRDYNKAKVTCVVQWENAMPIRK